MRERKEAEARHPVSLTLWIPAQSILRNPRTSPLSGILIDVYYRGPNTFLFYYTYNKEPPQTVLVII